MTPLLLLLQLLDVWNEIIGKYRAGSTRGERFAVCVDAGGGGCYRNSRISDISVRLL